MSGLKLKLRAGEQVLINGVVLQNGDRAAEMTVKTQGAHILRLRDAIHPSEVNTPVKRVCYVAQLAVAGEATADAALGDLTRGIAQLLQVFREDTIRETLETALAEARGHNFYRCMQLLRKLLPYEALVLARGKARPEKVDA
ncbi:MAG: flagellar biosynthesis repressor FlbT [Alphaproteobacteria bacterium]|nr:flagellar biosynthesis repressor FlbT [Alphaproteobacteria bacterium]MDX5369036.1 flagellar biosynthesis repressor FlbT [Alphaproteobacteria bacterium]MDX5463739.1 flagellar biosynthesis repressor FlbT [Alphaproteobacteria bacterium]